MCSPWWKMCGHKTRPRTLLNTVWPVFFVGSKFRSFRSLTAQNKYFSHELFICAVGVVHVHTQETKIEETKIYISAQNENLAEQKKPLLYGTSHPCVFYMSEEKKVP